jgi:hypothetical protein
LGETLGGGIIMNLYIKDSQKSEQGEEVGRALVQMIEQNLSIIDWKFHLTFTKFHQTSNIKIIYNSESCRIKFMFSRQRIPQHDELTIEYGRMHAPNEEPYMEWRGKKCRCWHNIIVPLRFLDGLLPSEAVQQAKIQKQSPIVVENFRQSELYKKLFSKYPPESSLVMHSVLWKHYGHQLFDLFDLRSPDLWERYTEFVKEYYGLLGMKASYGPPYENIC